MIVLRSVEDPSFPHNNEKIRAENKLGGTILQRISENKTKIFNISQTDLKGNLPKSLINKVSSKGFAQWYSNLKNGLEKYVRNKK